MNLFDDLHAAADSGGPTVRRLERLRPLRLLPLAKVAVAPQVPRVRPLVSVIIPCYNYGHFLPASIASVLTQSGVNVEVIVVDDASTDDSLLIARRVADSDKRVQVLSNAVNAGHVQTFNNGYAVATGDLIVRLDADDLLTPGSLARSAALFERFPSVGLVYGHPRHFVTAEPPGRRLGDVSWTIWSGHDWLAERCRVGVNCITTPEAVIRRDVMLKIGALNPHLKYAQDMEMWLRTSAVSDVGRVNEVDQALHRDHDASMSATVGSSALTDLIERQRVFELLFDGVGDVVAGADQMRARAMSALASEALKRACRLYDRGRDIGPVDDYVQFAVETYPGVHGLRTWRALERRRRVGGRIAKMTPPFLITAVVRRANDELAYLRWARLGI